MTQIQKILKRANNQGKANLSEYESKQVLADYGLPIVPEMLVKDWETVKDAVDQFGYPLVLKACSPEIIHKTEKKLIELDIREEEELKKAFKRIKEKIEAAGGDVLLQKMIKGERELVIGMLRDSQFGPCVMFGLGGIFTEILYDVTFRVAPVELKDVLEMFREIRGYKILDAVRGLETVNKEKLAECVIALGKIGLENPNIKEVDVNPIVVDKGQPVVVDALINLSNK